jgi:D-alanine-D-alanine ligase
VTAPCIVIVCGGESAEAEVSRRSAQGVTRALAQNFDQIHTLELDRHLAHNLTRLAPDVVFPVLHGPPGEDGTVQGFLEILQIPYVGSGVHASATGMDKVLSKHCFRDSELDVARQMVVHRSDSIPAAVSDILEQLGDYIVVKPARQGSAIGVFRVDNANQLHAAITAAFDYDTTLLVEQRIDGREITVGVLETDEGLEAFPVIEVRTPENTWYDYEHRYTAGLSQHVMPAELDAEQTDRLQWAAIAAHTALGCRDLSRADFVVPNRATEILLEVNTLPGMTPTSLYPEGAAAIGYPFEKLVQHLIERALRRKQ